jgi:hypothetical protein
MFSDEGGVGTVSSSVRRARSRRGSFVRVPAPGGGAAPSGFVVLRGVADRLDPLGADDGFGVRDAAARFDPLAPDALDVDRFDALRGAGFARRDDWPRAALRRADVFALRPRAPRALARFPAALRAGALRFAMTSSPFGTLTV